jgi:uncharacterized protein YndB with AHSA1/START domain
MESFIHDWTTFSLRITIKASITEIFDYWIYPEKIEQFFLEKADFVTANNTIRNKKTAIEKGDCYTWKWHGSSSIATGEVIHNNNNNELVFSFFNCTVVVKVFEFEGEHMLELTQSNISTDEESKANIHIGCTRGWTFYMTNLKSIIEGGIDLRNRNEKLGDVINT